MIVSNGCGLFQQLLPSADTDNHVNICNQRPWRKYLFFDLLIILLPQSVDLMHKP